MNILVFGDSVVSDELYLGFERWVTKLRKFLNSGMEHLNQEYVSVFNLGIVGETSKDLLERIDTECKAREPNIIIVKIGANDSRFNNVTEESIETPVTEFEKNIREIIKICKKYTSKIIFLGNTPVDESKTTPTIWSNTEYFTNKTIKKYDEIIRSICKKEDIAYLDIFNMWTKIGYKKLLDEEDGLHPNSEGHQKIFEIVKEFLIKNEVIL
ncbi:MAG: SGNH/GDSL hydrolase family protein [Candidatus Aenigmarchaeota archaeon]|nr:SGNH/GDSL hydrolase family protein [Candidatus Aenigmarchaeota archaeon]